MKPKLNITRPSPHRWGLGTTLTVSVLTWQHKWEGLALTNYTMSVFQKGEEGASTIYTIQILSIILISFPGHSPASHITWIAAWKGGGHAHPALIHTPISHTTTPSHRHTPYFIGLLKWHQDIYTCHSLYLWDHVLLLRLIEENSESRTTGTSHLSTTMYIHIYVLYTGCMQSGRKWALIRVQAQQLCQCTLVSQKSTHGQSTLQVC